jgi:hypothetical protein
MARSNSHDYVPITMRERFSHPLAVCMSSHIGHVNSMKTILLLLMLVAVVRADEPMLTKFFRVEPSLTRSGTKEDFQAMPLIKDGLEQVDLAQSTDSKEFFEARGVSFPPGASAKYHKDALLLEVTNTAENLKKVVEFMRIGRFGDDVKSLRVETHIVELPPEIATKLRTAIPLPDFQKEYGNRVKYVSTSGIMTRSANRAFAETESAEPFSRKREDWPPPRGVERTVLEVSPILSRDEAHMDVELNLRHASPAGGGQPPILVNLATNVTLPDEHVINVKSFTVRDPKSGIRQYAVLVSCTLLDGTSRSVSQAREEADRLFKKGSK